MSSAPDLRPILEDLLRLAMADAPGFSNRQVDQIQLEYITNPYGRQPPHVLVFPDGRVERMTSFQLPVPGYAANVVAVELLGYPSQPPTPTQLASLAALGAQVRQTLSGKIGFTGNADLITAATAGADADRPAFMSPDALRMVQPEKSPAAAMSPSKVQDIFDILGTPSDRRDPLAPGSIFNTVNNIRNNTAVVMRQLFKAPGVRDVERLVVVSSHDSFKPEPEDAGAFNIDALRKADIRLGMTDFRGHYLIAKDGTLVAGRDLETVGNCWPGKNEKAIQIVIAGNGKNPTREQRETLFLYAAAMRKHYERPIHANVREIVFADQLLGIDPLGVMKDELANPRVIDADVPSGKGQNQRAAV